MCDDWITETYINDLRDAANKHYLAVKRVRELHKPHTTNFSNVERLECLGCFTFESDDFGDEWTNYKPYPCPTIKALDGETDEA